MKKPKMRAQLGTNKKIEVEGLRTSEVFDAYNEMIDALIEAKRTIRSWHGEEAWDLYQHSPEMKKVNNALKKAGCTDE